jgi:hypothetical protein
LTAGGLSRKRQRLAGGVEILRKHRDSRGSWQRFPFYYTLLALIEIEGKAVTGEMRYAAPRLERMLKRRVSGERFDLRRRAVAERMLARI